MTVQRQEDERLAVFARRIVALDPGIPLGLLVYRINDNSTPNDGTRRRLYTVVNTLLLSGWLRDVSEGDPGQRPISRRLYTAVPFCNCGDSVYTGYRCPDESTFDSDLSACPARKRARINHE